ncbi:alpha/beta fold hydrolase [Ferrovibrio xuzhouensis]|uniref:Alpha/beta fold hydrolase n=1 Tax=Ferrovibrio xuzhouensis TaxID=1576914 RepID=A0ABV7VKD0_9PROT
MSAQVFTEHFFHAQDDLRLYYRDYGDRHSPRLPLLCLPGLTRNSKDFHDLASRYASQRRVITVDYRGRGRSAYDPDPRHYDPVVYLADLQNLLAVAHVEQVVVLGTSMGGLLAMGMTAAMPAVLAGIILNDVGPDIDRGGYGRIAQTIGTAIRAASFEDAAELWRRSDQAANPRLDTAGWLKLAHATFRQDDSGSGVRLDYDIAIGKALQAQADAPLPDLWPLFRGLRNLPLLALRGALSDVLSADTFIRMKREHASMTAVTIPDVGHVPMLDEPEALAAIDEFLAGL